MRRIQAAAALAATITILASAVGQAAPGAGLPAGGKPMFQGDARHTGQSRYAGPRAPRLAARFDTRQGGEARADIQSAIAVSPDGTAYVTNFRGGLFALREPTGGAAQMQAAWTYRETGMGSWHATAAVDDAGTVYLPLSSFPPPQPPAQATGALYAFGPDGRVRWKADLGGRSTASPTIGPDGTIYQLVDAGNLVAISAEGARRWAARVGPSFVSSPALAPDGTVYSLSSDGKLYAVGPDGAVKWSADYGSQLGPTPLKTVTPPPGGGGGGGAGGDGRGAGASPTVGPDGTVYFGASNSNFYAFGPDGRMKWLFEAERELAGVWSTAALSADGQTVYFGANAGGVYALETATGRRRWQAPLYGTVYAATELDREGRLYVATTSGHVIALDAATGRQLWDWSANGQPAASSIWTAPAILPDGRLIVADRDGVVYLLADATPAAPAAGAGLPRSGQPAELVFLSGAAVTLAGAWLRRRARTGQPPA